MSIVYEALVILALAAVLTWHIDRTLKREARARALARATWPMRQNLLLVQRQIGERLMPAMQAMARDFERAGVSIQALIRAMNDPIKEPLAKHWPPRDGEDS